MDSERMRTRTRVSHLMNRWSSLVDARWPRGVGVAASAVVILGSLAYGVVKGDHVASIVTAMRDARAGTANSAGFRIVSIALAGNHHVTREEVLATAGITGTTSLLFLDVGETRERLKTNPWIADATVLKLYPGELQIGIKEREAFALWQKDGQVSVIADDGTVLEPYVAPGLIRLPLVVGRGAETRAKGFLGGLDPYPAKTDFGGAAWAGAPRRGRRSFWRCSTAIPRCATSCAPRCWSANGAGTCGSRTASTCGCPNPTSHPRSSGWSRSIARRI